MSEFSDLPELPNGLEWQAREKAFVARPYQECRNCGEYDVTRVYRPVPLFSDVYVMGCENCKWEDQLNPHG